MIVLLLIACGDPDPCAGQRDQSISPSGLGLTPEEHPGWARDSCVECHPTGTYHQLDCMVEVEVDLEALPERGAEECTACHGSNGVSDWEDTGS